jgi:hypothetical protein
MAANKTAQDDTSSPEIAAEAKDNVNSDTAAAPNPKKQPKTRHRASVACASCRDRRIRVCIS